MKHFLKLADFSGEELIDILNLADQLKFEQRNRIPHKHLEGKTLGMIFSKSSSRTRISFEVGMFQLGGTALYLNYNDIQLGRGESIQDSARVFSRFLDGIMIRTFNQQDVEDLAAYGTIPIINGLTDYCHPCQVMADLQTIREEKSRLEGLKMCFIGDGNNMANSLIVGGIKTGMQVAIACPDGYRPDSEIMKWGFDTGLLTVSDDIEACAKDADVLYTDVWASMGQEGERESRKKAFAGYQINDGIMSVAKPDAMVLHCLPAHKEEEITAKVFEEHAREIFEEAENRLHAQKAIMVKLMKD